MKCRCTTEMYQQEDITGTLYWICPDCHHTETVTDDKNAWSKK